MVYSILEILDDKSACSQTGKWLVLPDPQLLFHSEFLPVS